MVSVVMGRGAGREPPPPPGGRVSPLNGTAGPGGGLSAWRDRDGWPVDEKNAGVEGTGHREVAAAGGPPVRGEDPRSRGMGARRLHPGPPVPAWLAGWTLLRAEPFRPGEHLATCLRVHGLDEVAVDARVPTSLYVLFPPI